MKAVVQRVSRAAVRVDGETVGQIQRGLLVFLGIGKGDAESDAEWMINKLLNLRVFPDEVDKMNRSVVDIGGGILVVSQFTLYGDARKGHRPSFSEAARPEVAAPLVEKFAEFLHAQGIQCQTGVFGAHMLVEIENDGPVTIWLEK